MKARMMEKDARSFCAILGLDLDYGLEALPELRSVDAMRCGRRVKPMKSALFPLLLFLVPAMFAADDFKVVVLDSKDAHALRGKLVCLTYPVGDPHGGVV